ncbi:KTSC domain-containing protein [Erwinia billingiae]|uniref:KTSC domain-containing protein n=1 Tax=Erwinia billingiae TaxID=182337 RepID=UPI00092D466F|nr:KTSC domain-containing protein [Erwinia billingiae]
MTRKPVISSSLKSVGYDQETSTLEISFRHGQINQYFGVRSHVHRALMNADSKKQFFEENIRRSFTCRNIG